MTQRSGAPRWARDGGNGFVGGMTKYVDPYSHLSANENASRLLGEAIASIARGHFHSSLSQVKEGLAFLEEILEGDRTLALDLRAKD